MSCSLTSTQTIIFLLQIISCGFHSNTCVMLDTSSLSWYLIFKLKSQYYNLIGIESNHSKTHNVCASRQSDSKCSFKIQKDIFSTLIDMFLDREFFITCDSGDFDRKVRKKILWTPYSIWVQISSEQVKKN